MTKPLVSRRRRLRPRRTVLPLRARTMENSHLPGLLGFAHHLNVFLAQFAAFNDGAAQVAFALASFVAQQVFLARLAAFQFARGSDAEAFLGTFMRLHLGHGVYPVGQLQRLPYQKRKGPLVPTRGPGIYVFLFPLGKAIVRKNHRRGQRQNARAVKISEPASPSGACLPWTALFRPWPGHSAFPGSW